MTTKDEILRSAQNDNKCFTLPVFAQGYAPASDRLSSSFAKATGDKQGEGAGVGNFRQLQMKTLEAAG